MAVSIEMEGKRYPVILDNKALKAIKEDFGLKTLNDLLRMGQTLGDREVQDCYRLMHALTGQYGVVSLAEFTEMLDREGYTVGEIAIATVEAINEGFQPDESEEKKKKLIMTRKK